jgi:hypothetical protein
MIGVLAKESECEAVAEFFQLFKTPWDFVRRGSHYEIILSTVTERLDASCRLLLLFNSKPTFVDAERKADTKSRSGGIVTWDGRRIPIYGTLTTFRANESIALMEDCNSEPAAVLEIDAEQITVRVGYDLFSEVSVLLTVGQPSVNAAVPTLDEHISLLRHWIVSAGLSLIEIPPIPDGYNFVTCLTHDIDHPAVRRHLCDHTMFGFVYRSTIATLLNVFTKKRNVETLFRNWKAACLLPLVHLRLAKDFWSDFDRYLEMEDGDASTYFVIPRSNYPGRTADGFAPRSRACRYSLCDVLPQLKRIISAKSEVGVHGVDAWLDAEDGRAERETVARAIGATELGVRMHWLFFDVASPRRLERAGFTYDSSVGYRDAIGYRAGTLQVYKPLGARRLLELPLHVMDTALFYPSYLNLVEDEARRLVWKLIDDAERMGGSFTINWHDRSISPERLWDDFYLKLVHELRSRKAWLPTASQAVAWFRKRRSVTFETLQLTNTRLIRASFEDSDSLPGLRLRVHQPRAVTLAAEPRNTGVVEFEDLPLTRTTELTLSI